MIWRVVICHKCCLSLLVYLVVLMGNGTNTLLLILLMTDGYEYWIKDEVMPSHTWLVGQSSPRSPATAPGWLATPPLWLPDEPPGSRSTIRADGVVKNYMKRVLVTDQHLLKTTHILLWGSHNDKFVQQSRFGQNQRCVKHGTTCCCMLPRDILGID